MRVPDEARIAPPRLRARGALPPRTRPRVPAGAVAGALAFLALVSLYRATAAPDLTFWDAAEFATAAKTLGIPHPPGTPLWTLLANVCARLFSAFGPAASVTMLSVVTTALAGALGAVMASRWIGARGAVAAAVGAGSMMSVWANATETEVYGASLLLAVSMLFAGERAGRVEIDPRRRGRWRALVAFLAGLAVPLHLSALVALPAAVVFAWSGGRPRVRDLVGWAMLLLLGVSAVAVLPLLAAGDPSLNSGNPVTLRTLVAVLRREQFAVPGLFPRMAPIWLQFGNVLQWADFQVGFALHPLPTPSWRRTPLTVVWVVAALTGLRALFRLERRAGRALAVLLACGTFGVAFWLNMRAGPSFGYGVLPDGAIREARERDYFFALGFWCWGLLAGIGIVRLAALLAGRILPRLPARVGALVLPLLLLAALVPLAGNGAAMRRNEEPLALLPRLYGRLLLDAVPRNGVLFVAGDNDTFPLWYLQQVEDHRSDVTVVTIPLLGATWYRDELRRRHGLLDAETAAGWRGLDATLGQVTLNATRLGRALRVGTLVERRDRGRVLQGAGWRFEGLVYAPDVRLAPGSVTVDVARTIDTRDRIPPWALEPLPAGIDCAGRQIQRLLACARVTVPRSGTAVDDVGAVGGPLADSTLLVPPCGDA